MAAERTGGDRFWKEEARGSFGGEKELNGWRWEVLSRRDLKGSGKARRREVPADG
jgi:hypothetical protein